MTRTILLIDDEQNLRWVLAKALEQAGYTVHTAPNGDEGLALLAREPIELVLLDLKLRGEDGLTVLRRLHERRSDLMVMLLTAYGTVATAVEAMQLGAIDVLRKPFDLEEIVFKIARGLERRALQQEVARLTAAQRQLPALEDLVGADPAWQRLITHTIQIARQPEHVLIIGEPSTGRTTIAQSIHAASAHAAAPLVLVDLDLYQPDAHIPTLFGNGANGRWAAAGSGSLIIRGLTSVSPAAAVLTEYILLQHDGGGPRLLLISEPGSQVPEELTRRVPLRLTLPALRDRPGDCALFIQHFAQGRSISASALVCLERYHWPGNIAELRGVIQRACQLAGDSIIDTTHLPVLLQHLPTMATTEPIQLPPEGVRLEAVEQSLIRQALIRVHGNKSRAAELLGLTRHTLLYRMEKYGISTSERP